MKHIFQHQICENIFKYNKNELPLDEVYISNLFKEKLNLKIEFINDFAYMYFNPKTTSFIKIKSLVTKNYTNKHYILYTSMNNYLYKIHFKIL